MTVPHLPPEFLSRMKNLLGAEFDQFADHYRQPPDIGLRINTLKISPADWQAISPFATENVPWAAEGFRVLKPESAPGKHPYHAAGLYYLQDIAAMAAGTLLDPQPGESVLDLAAAPGGKSTHLAARMQPRGWLVVNDPHRGRIQPLVNNLARWGARQTTVLNETPQRLVSFFGDRFDRVLVDAPCSGEGMFRKDPSACSVWTPAAIERYASRQDEILSHAAGLLRPGGRLVYSTCTFAPEEDEGTIQRFLDTHPDFSILPAPEIPGLDGGRPDWLVPPGRAELAHTVRIWPHRAPGEGHFIAVLQREGNSASRRPPGWAPPPIPADALALYREFCAATLIAPPAEGQVLALMGNRLYALPEHLPALHGLKVLEWGWHLGTVKTRRFEPSHALASGLRMQDCKNVLNLPPTNARLQAYLRGETFPHPGPKAWVLVCVDGFPLGWGKRVKHRLQSKIPSWLRRLR